MGSCRENYPDGGLVTLPRRKSHGNGGNILGPRRERSVRFRTINADNYVEEVERSDELLEKFERESTRLPSRRERAHRCARAGSYWPSVRTICVPNRWKI